MASEFGDKKVFDSVADLQDPSRSTLSSLFTYLYKKKPNPSEVQQPSVWMYLSPDQTL